METVQDAPRGPDAAKLAAGKEQPSLADRTADFLMDVYKIQPCALRSRHPWANCPYAHPGENSVRRDHRAVPYLSLACPQSQARRPCPRGADCPFAHSAYEYFLHPDRLRTQMCRNGDRCQRSLCFFAHSPEELRPARHAHLTVEQVEVLFDARAALGLAGSAMPSVADQARLAEALATGILGELPPLPQQARAAAPVASGGSAGAAPLAGVAAPWQQGQRQPADFRTRRQLADLSCIQATLREQLRATEELQRTMLERLGAGAGGWSPAVFTAAPAPPGGAPLWPVAARVPHCVPLMGGASGGFLVFDGALAGTPPAAQPTGGCPIMLAPFGGSARMP
ncbi:hypothetical protein Rsub_05816 [Raphidocelis subcapitata]|uniref:C3H1-type domain-containing protein n=1 Tax=Raphidocelis subcapitata TaxID=307507 RepID=A0A2V0P550_9CHLO|nr:hypothetical protein Rsub_05816 [Raphidocelis subcapitata]|eukprot:GBF92980.1 hypothetical protein Rsub_05816 [Raphidocelis subcapitata]